MPITVKHGIDALLLGPAYSSAGAAARRRADQERERELAEQARQFNEQLALRQQALEADIANQDFRNRLAGEQQGLDRQLAGERSRLDRYDLAQRGYQADENRAADLAKADLSGQYGLAKDAMRYQAIAAQDAIEQQSRAGEQQAQFQQQQELAEQNANAQLRNRLQFEVPDDIKMGIQRGWLTYTPEQKTEIKKLQSAMSRLGSDPRMNPSQRMQGQVAISQRMNEVLNSPSEVPPDERPLSMQEMFEQETTPIDDPVTGKTHRMQRGERNGMPTWTAVEYPEDPSEKAELARQKTQADIEKKRLEQQESARKARLDRAIKAMDARMPDIKHYTSIDAEGNQVIDRKGFESALSKWEQKYDAMLDQYGAADTLGAQGETDQMAAMLADMGMPPPAEAPQDDFEVIGPNQVGRYAKRYPDGRIELLPEGFAP